MAENTRNIAELDDLGVGVHKLPQLGVRYPDGRILWAKPGDETGAIGGPHNETPTGVTTQDTYWLDRVTNNTSRNIAALRDVYARAAARLALPAEAAQLTLLRRNVLVVIEEPEEVEL